MPAQANDLADHLVGQLALAAVADHTRLLRRLHITARVMRSTPARWPTVRRPEPASHARSTSTNLDH
jgi:hypothetical protein